jgi:hypothetical protein
MNDMTLCGNYEALIAYVYDECDPAERESIAAHVALCASCTEEIQALRDTRAHLGAWSPPSLPLGFQMTRTESDTPAALVLPKPRSGESGWWRQPLPGWAQVAAAAVIFAAGMSVSAVRSSDAPVVASVGRPVAGTTSVAMTTVSRDELARLDARLRSVESAQAERVSLQLPRTTAASVNEQELFERVQAIVDAQVALSEGRQRGMLAGMAREVDRTTQRVDVVTERLAFVEDELPRTQQGLRQLAVRTSYQPASIGR